MGSAGEAVRAAGGWDCWSKREQSGRSSARAFNESEMARSSECKEQFAQKTLDTAE
jgi:hypothetical protein